MLEGNQSFSVFTTNFHYPCQSHPWRKIRQNETDENKKTDEQLDDDQKSGLKIKKSSPSSNNSLNFHSS